MEHWTPPNRGVVSMPTFSVGMGQGASAKRGTLSAPANGGSSRPRGNSKGEDPTIKDKANRSRRNASGSETYGPAGVVTVCRSYHGPGCPDCATGKEMRRMPNGSGPGDNFRGGRATGYKEG